MEYKLNLRTGLKILITLFFTLASHAQYLDLSIDPNKAFGGINNPRTEKDHRGIDVDLELGVARQMIGAYIFYGIFSEAEYQNYGIGSDLYFYRSERITFAAGPQITMVLRKRYVGANYEIPAWAGMLALAFRSTGTFWITDRIGMSGRIQYQRRPDISIGGIIEGSIGVKYQLKK